MVIDSNVGAFLLMVVVWLSVVIERSCSSGVICHDDARSNNRGGRRSEARQAKRDVSRTAI